MPLMPKRIKDNHRKMHRGNRGGNATSGDYVAFGDFGLQVLTRGWVTNNQIEASVSPSTVTCAVVAAYTSVSSRRRASPSARRIPVWVRVKVLLRAGSPYAAPATSCSRLAVLPSPLPVRPSASLPTSSASALASYTARAWSPRPKPVNNKHYRYYACQES